MKISSLGILLALCLLPTISSPTNAKEWKSADKRKASMENRLINKDYEVSITENNISWSPIKVYGALVSNLDIRDKNWTDFTGKRRSVMGFSLFTSSFEAPVKVRVTRKGVPFKTVEIRPLSYNIEPRKIDDNTIEFELQSPKEKVSVEFDGDRQHNLFVIPDLPDKENPKASSENIRYYGAGEHNVGSIVLKSNETLYLDEGAIVYSSVSASNAENIAIKGRGILCGSKNDHNRDTRGVLVNLENCKNITVEGVLFRDSPNWTLRILNGENIHINNHKQICWMLNSDGIDICNSRNTLIENCFLRNYDDNISIKTFHWGSQISENVIARNNVFWADAAHNFLVGPEAGPDKVIRNFRLENSIILESREWLYPYTGAIGVMISENGNFSDVTVENVVIEDIRGGQLLCIDFGNYNGPGNSGKNFTIRNLKYKGTNASKNILRGLNQEHPLENILLENITINDTLIDAENFTRFFETNSFVKDLRFGK